MTETQKPVAWLIEFENGETELHFYDLNNSLGFKQTALYSDPLVTPDVLKDAQRYRWLRDKAGPELKYGREQYTRVCSVCHNDTENLDAAIDAAMGGAND